MNHLVKPIRDSAGKIMILICKNCRDNTRHMQVLTVSVCFELNNPYYLVGVLDSLRQYDAGHAQQIQQRKQQQTQ